MARQWRVQYEDAVYHVMSRGVIQGAIFLGNEDYQRFLDCLERASEKFRLEIFAFVLMGNHYHLLLRTKEANLSKAMQWLQTSYTIYYNRRHNRSGHFFQGRYKSILVGEESYWQSLSFYIHLNPIRAGMVKELDEYKWSSYHDYVRMKKIHKWVLCEEILSEFGYNKQEQKNRYKELIIERCGQERKILGEIRYRLILGSDKFVNWVQKRFVNQSSIKDKELPQQKMIGDNGVIERVIAEVTKEFGISRDKLLERKRKVSEIPRDVGMYILKMYTGLDNKRIGNIFGVSLSAVTKAANRVSEQIRRREKELKVRIDDIVNSIFKV